MHVVAPKARSKLDAGRKCRERANMPTQSVANNQTRIWRSNRRAHHWPTYGGEAREGQQDIEG
jgi:hypothetical protein